MRSVWGSAGSAAAGAPPAADTSAAVPVDQREAPRRKLAQDERLLGLAYINSVTFWPVSRCAYE